MPSLAATTDGLFGTTTARVAATLETAEKILARHDTEDAVLTRHDAEGRQQGEDHATEDDQACEELHPPSYLRSRYRHSRESGAY